MCGDFVVKYFTEVKLSVFIMEIKDLETIDSKCMFKVYDSWPDIARESFEKKFEKIDIKNFDHIVFAGMGGSGSIGDALSVILSKENIHVSNTKGYLLPKTVDQNSLIVVMSASGNTQETLSILNDATKSKAKVVAFSSGGKMQDFCLRNNIFFQNISMEHSPRASFARYLFSIVNILEQVIPIKKTDVNQAILDIKNIQSRINSSNLEKNNESLELAKWVKNNPLIYYPGGLEACAIRCKNSFQENSKLHAFVEEVFESCHNGIMSWERQTSIQPILMQGQDDHPKTKERWKILKEYFQEKNIPYRDIYSVKGNIFSKIVNLIYVLDYATIYHAIISKIDPSPVSSIEYIKTRL